MDERGYISIDIVGIEKNMGIEKEEIGRIMGVMKGFDKKGIFERDMSEWIEIKLSIKERLDKEMEEMIENIDIMERRDFEKIKKIWGVDKEEMIEMMEEIREIDKKKGESFEV